MIRIARQDDVKQIMEIVKETVVDLNKEGNIQWSDEYPKEENFLNDIKEKSLYIYEQDCKVAGFICINTSEDQVYQGLSWSKDSTAIVIHRFAVRRDQQKRGVGSKLIEFAEKFAKNKQINYLRVDTNSKNSRMNQLFKKMGFQFIGTITLRNLPDLFNCYDKVLDQGD